MKTETKIHKYFIVAILIFINLLVWSVTFAGSPRKNLSVSFLDIGQGDSILITAPNGRQILIDGGRDSTVLNRLGQKLGFFDRSIDVVLATHPDADHIGGLPFVIDRYQVSYLVDSLIDSDTNAYKALLATAENHHLKTYFARRGMIIVLDEKAGVYLHVLYPEADDFVITDTNDMSIVVKLVYGDTAFVLTGDAPKDVEAKLVSTDGNYLRSNILKAGHHGSKTSSSPSFVADVHPAYGVISAGKNNSYGHPHQETLDTLAAAGAEIVSTIDLGTITFESNGVDVWMK